MMINMIDEEATKRTDKVPEEEEEDAYPKKTTFRHRIRDLIPFPWKRRRRKYKRKRREAITPQQIIRVEASRAVDLDMFNTRQTDQDFDTLLIQSGRNF